MIVINQADLILDETYLVSTESRGYIQVSHHAISCHVMLQGAFNLHRVLYEGQITTLFLDFFIAFDRKGVVIRLSLNTPFCGTQEDLMSPKDAFCDIQSHDTSSDTMQCHDV